MTTRIFRRLAFVGSALLFVVGCTSTDPTQTVAEPSAVIETSAPSVVRNGAVRVGFVAVGPEGAWRSANEANIRETFSERNGFDLTYAPAKNLDQASQFEAMRTFIAEPVDVILLSCTDATGWEEVLGEAAAKRIPVVLIDRGIKPNNSALYATRIAPDNFEISRQVAEWATKQFPNGANYYVLEGPPGVSVVTERNFGWNSVVELKPTFRRVGSSTANWSLAEGRRVFADALRKNGNNIQVVFAQNDEMGLGAVLAVKDAGLQPGVDVKIATIDGTRAALESLARNELSFVAEYEPDFGDVALVAVRNVLAGGDVVPFITVPGRVFETPREAEEALPGRRY